MITKVLGSYLGRKVVVCDDQGLITDEVVLSSSLIMIWCVGVHGKENLNTFIDYLIKKRPLGITVAGHQVDNRFDYLLEKLSSPKIERHIMTGIIRSENLTESVEEFLLSAIPSEELFDVWNSYWLVMTNDVKTSELEDLKALLD
jgi:hypothetical protein